MFHPTITKTTFSFFKCTQAIEGVRLLEADMHIVCGSSYHSRLLLWVAGPAMIFYVIGIPTVALWLIYARRTKLDSVGSRRKLGFLYSNYEPRYYCE